MTVQISIIRIEGYGPWTLTRGSDREHELQILQAKLYSDVQKLFAERGGLVFFNRFDEMFAVTNNITKEAHVEILNELNANHDLDISMSIGNGSTPYGAHLEAYDARKRASNTNQTPKVYGQSGNTDHVQIMHVDVDGSTSMGSDRLNPYQMSSLICALYSRLSEQFMKNNAMTFFLGGDNFMIIANGMKREETAALLNVVTNGTDVRLKCGIGKARTGRKAAEMATKALDTIRDLRESGKLEQIFELSCF